MAQDFDILDPICGPSQDAVVSRRRHRQTFEEKLSQTETSVSRCGEQRRVVLLSVAVLRYSQKGFGSRPGCIIGALVHLKWLKTILSIYNSGEFCPSFTVERCWIESRTQDTLKMDLLGVLVIMFCHLSLTFTAPVIGKKFVSLHCIAPQGSWKRNEL